MKLRGTAIAAALALGTMSSALAQKDTVTLGMTLEPPMLDPTGGSPAQAIREITYGNVFEGLVRIDRQGTVRPLLAERWSLSADGLTYTFNLRSGVRFHDGTSFDSADVKFTLDRAMAAESTNSQKWIFAPIASVATPDATTVVITLKQPSGGFVHGLAWGDAVIFAPESVANNKTDPVGTGPFKFERWVRGDRVELTRFEEYWNRAAVKLRRASFRFIADANAQLAAMRAGDIDAMANFGVPEAVDQIRSDRRFAVVLGATEGETVLGINNAKAPFNDVRVRRAIAHALDRKAIIDGAMSGYGTPIGSHFSPAHPAYVDLTGMYPHDPARARALLAEAGLANGFTATLKLPPPPYARRSGEIVAAQLARVGIRVTIEPVEFAQWLDQVFNRREYDLSIIAHTEPLDINIYARDPYYFNYTSAEFRALMARLDATADDAGRARLLGEAQRMLANDSVNGFLFQLPKIGVWNADLEGMWENWPLPANALIELSWKR